MRYGLCRYTLDCDSASAAGTHLGAMAADAPPPLLFVAAGLTREMTGLILEFLGVTPTALRLLPCGDHMATSRFLRRLSRSHCSWHWCWRWG